MLPRNCIFNFFIISSLQLDDNIQNREERGKLAPECQTFGNKTLNSDHVPDCLNDLKKGTVQKILEEKSESIYDTHIREPLGTAYKRVYQLPPEVADPNHSYGLPTIFSESAKNLLYPNEIKPLDEATHKQYVKTHKDYDAAEAKTRDYEWPPTIKDPETHRYGYYIDNPYLESRLCLNPKLDPKVNIPNVIPKAVEDKKSLGDHLGKVRHLGITPQLDENHVFGVDGRKKGEWGALDCIYGHDTPEQQQPDKDLGRATRPGWRNITTETRRFGVPTVRSDIPEPVNKSVADYQCYSMKDNAFNLLHPATYHALNLDDEDFTNVRAKEDIRQIFESINYSFTDEEFEKIYSHAAQQDANGEVSVESFRNCMNDYLGHRDEDKYPEWW